MTRILLLAGSFAVGFLIPFPRPTLFAASVLLVALVVELAIQRYRRIKAEDGWRQSEERYRTALQDRTDLVCRYLPDTTLTYVNDSFCRLWGKERAELIGRRFVDFVPEGARDGLRHHIASLVSNVRIATYQHPVLLADGGEAWQEWLNRGIADARGEVVEIEGLGKDITDRRRADEALRESEARNSAVLHALPDTMFLLTGDGLCLDYHEQPANEPASDIVGRNIRDVFPASVADTFFATFEQAARSQEPVVVEYSLPNGAATMHYEARLVCFSGDRFLVIVRDVTDRCLRDESLREHRVALRASYEEIRDLAGRLIAAQEMERRRIARELHDDISQKLAMLSIDIERNAGKSQPIAGDPSQGTRLLMERAAEIASDVHRLSYQLHPSKLEALGLVRAVESYCREISRQHSISVAFHQEGVPIAIPSELALCMYRIVQEGLGNVVKHSNATDAWVSLRGAGGKLELRIADHGAGFVATAQERKGLGLVSMRERARFLGGEFIMHSAPGMGTRIGVIVPMECSLQRSA